MVKRNDIRITRSEAHVGVTPSVSMKITLEYDEATAAETFERLGRALRELIPGEDDRAQFMTDLRRAGKAAGLMIA